MRDKLKERLLGRLVRNGVSFPLFLSVMSFKERKVKFEPKVKPNHNIYPEPSDISNIYLVYKVPYLHFPLASQVRMILF